VAQSVRLREPLKCGLVVTSGQVDIPMFASPGIGSAVRYLIVPVSIGVPCPRTNRQPLPSWLTQISVRRVPFLDVRTATGP
jgi:hypothetical protein